MLLFLYFIPNSENANANYTLLDISSPSCTSIIFEAFECENKNFLECIAYGLISDTQNLKVNYNELAKKIIYKLKTKKINLENIKNNILTISERCEKLGKLAIERGKIIVKNNNTFFCTYILQDDLLDSEKSLQSLNH